MNALFRGGAALMLALAGTATAAAQTYRYDYAATAAGDTIGSFTVAQDGPDYRLTAFSGTIGGIGYTLPDVGLFPSGSGFNIGGLSDVAYRVDPSTNDFFFLDDIVPGAASFTNTFVYSLAADPGIRYVDIDLTATETAAAVPAPATWTSAILGFGLLGTTWRFRRRSTRPSPT